MAGWVGNGFQFIQALVQNGVTASPVPLTNLPIVTAAITMDTEAPAGQNPQTVNASPFQIAAAAAVLISNTASSTAHTATLNTVGGLMTTEALTTAAGANYTFQIVNSGIVSASTPAPQVQIHDGTNTAGGAAVASITNAAGTCTAVFTNTGTAAWNGTKLIAFHL